MQFFSVLQDTVAEQYLMVEPHVAGTPSGWHLPHVLQTFPGPQSSSDLHRSLHFPASQNSSVSQSVSFSHVVLGS
jgi:hypothetical protein